MIAHLPVVTGKELVRALQKVEWEVFHVRGSHYQLEHSETKRKITVPVHAGKEIKRGLLRSILRDLGISVEQFRSLI